MATLPKSFYQHPIPTHLTRHNAVGKVRRPLGDPIAEFKEMTRFEPTPRPAPHQLKVPLSVFDPHASEAAIAAKKLVFHTVGDVGGVNSTATEEAIAGAMEDQLAHPVGDGTPAFLYLLGDVIYYNGEQSKYKTEFYEPYQYYRALIFAIPGNHDGDTHVRKGDPPDTEPTLFGFFENFCDAVPRYASPYRMSMTQPYPYWTLDAPFVTIIGLYSNVEGSLDARGRSDQQSYLEAQMTAADKDKKLLIAVHHPPYSLDASHGGTPDILNALDRAAAATGRTPDAILSGHVHNYQHFSRKIGDREIPYVIAGAGGYANEMKSLHRLQKGLVPDKNGAIKTTIPGVVLEKFNQEKPGFLRVTATSKQIAFEYFTVDFNPPHAVALFNSFTA